MTPEPHGGRDTRPRQTEKQGGYGPTNLPMTAAAAGHHPVGLGVFNIELPRDDGKALDALKTPRRASRNRPRSLTEIYPTGSTNCLHKFTWEGGIPKMKKINFYLWLRADPRSGQMYLGLMRRGAADDHLAAAIIGASALFRVPPLLFALPVVWFYCF